MRAFSFVLISIVFSTTLLAAEVAPSRGASQRRSSVRRLCKEVTQRNLRGEASHYANKWVGRPMACNGRPFSQEGQTASIKRTGPTQSSMLLPCGTVVRVTRTDRRGANGLPLTQEVTITDNGPLAPGRIIDLSTSVARRLEFGPGEGGGTIQVKLEVCTPY